jgi:hypothetical protein
MTRVLTIMVCLFKCFPVLAEVKINELFYQGNDLNAFIEIYSTTDVNLDDYHLSLISGSTGAEYFSIYLNGYYLAAGDYFVVGSTNVLPAPDYLLSRLYILRGPDSIILYNGSDVIDAVGYEPFRNGNYFYGENISAHGAPKGSSLGRYPDGTDSNDNRTDFKFLDVPSPGNPNLLYQAGQPTIMTLKQLRQSVSDYGSSSLEGRFVRVLGIVTVASGVLNNGNTLISIQDDEAGLSIYYNSGYLNVQASDYIEVEGTISDFWGTMEIGVPYINVKMLGTRIIPEPIRLDLNQINTLGEDYESMLVSISNLIWEDEQLTWPITDTTWMACLENDENVRVQVRFKNPSNMLFTGSPANYANFTIIGILSQFDPVAPFTDNYQITPRGSFDFYSSVSINSTTWMELKRKTR